MKTIYTDRLGIYPWALLFLSAMSFWWAYDTFTGGPHAPFGIDKTAGGIIFVLGGGCFSRRGDFEMFGQQGAKGALLSSASKNK